jgi:hypothetical protein
MTRQWLSKLVLAIFVLLIARPVAAGDFEGVLHMKITSSGRVSDMNIFAKGHHSRIEPRTEGAVVPFIIVDNEAKKHYTLMPDRKMYMESNTETVTKAAQPMMEQEGVEVVKTGKTGKVAGQPCEVYVARKKTGEMTEMCAIKGIGDYMSLMGMNTSDPAQRQQGPPSWMKELSKQGLFPARIISKRSDGSEFTRVETVKIEKRALDDALFMIPSDYTKYDMEAMMRPIRQEGQ